jgi:hypothetical protein
MGPELRRTLCYALAAGLLLVPGVEPAGGELPPQDRFALVLTVSLSGRYRLADGAFKAEGEYAFAAAWLGFLEKDDDDFIVYRAGTEERLWKMSEAYEGPGGAGTAGEAEAGGRPSLKLKLVSREADMLFVEFEAEGVSVPLGPRQKKVRLEFPASRAGPTGSPSAYDRSVTKGSNLVAVPLDKMREGRFSGSYEWTYTARKPWPGGSGTSVYENEHRVEATVEIRERTGPGAAPPAQARGW